MKPLEQHICAQIASILRAPSGLLKHPFIVQGCPRLPIIGMTAYALAGDRQCCLDVGMDEYISKPFEPEELKFKVFAILENAAN